MSFPPPRPPMHIPGMPPLPPMMPPPYPLPPMGGMIPVGMGMVPTPLEVIFRDKMMAPVPMTVPAPIPIPTPPKTPPKKLSQQQLMGKKPECPVSTISKGPPVTVFVGNITDRASDSLIRLLLQRCGTVVNWKRVQGANGKLQAFGFCEYADPESALRAIRLLHDWEIGDRKLVVKVDAKTKEKLDEYKASKKPRSSSEPVINSAASEQEGEQKKSEDDDLDEQTKRDDAVTRESITLILRDHSAELSRPFEYKEKPKKTNKSQDASKNSQDQAENDPKNNLDELELEEEKKSLIHREIDKFRDTYKRAEEEKERDRERKDKDRKERESRDNREARSSRDRENRHLHDSPQDRQRFRNRNREKSRDREQSPWERRNRDYRNRSRDRGSDRSRSRSRDREWSRERERSRERSKEKDWEKEKEEEEEAYEKKRLERKLREKEAAYQERLRNWEARERRRAKEYEKEKQKEEERRREEIKEARRLKEFLEDYDDERDDPKYYKGSALARRLKEREKEIEADARDRQREKEELEELRRKLAEDGHPDPEAEAKRIQQEEEDRMLKPKIKHESPDSDEPHEPEHKTKLKPIGTRERSLTPPVEEKPPKKIIEDENTQNSLSGFSDIMAPVEETKPLGFPGLKLGMNSPSQQMSRSPTSTPTSNVSISVPVVNKKKKITVDEVFTANDDDSSDQPKKRRLIPLDDTSDDSKSGSQMTTEEKKKHIKNLIDKIPTAKEQLFAYNIDWSLVDNSLMEMHIRPWINKKIIEYIGEEEPTLVDFICSKVLAGSSASSILEDVSMVLDEEAEVFVVKMWRLLIYEIEAKKLGLVK